MSDAAPSREDRCLAVIRTDATARLGGGHVVRCLTLADALARIGWRVAFASCRETAATVPALARSGHAIWTIPVSALDEAAWLAERVDGHADLLVVDHYERDHRFETAARAWASCLLAIDDLADRRHDVDLLLDQTLGRSPRDYQPLVPERCRCLIGPAYALLRPQFAAARPAALARRGAAPVRRMLVAMGTADEADATSIVLDGLHALARDIAIDVVLGSGAPHLARVSARAARRSGTTVHVDVPDMFRLMCDADLAIGAAGTSSWERCTLGLPSLIAVTADNQRLIATNLAKASAVELIADGGPFTASHVEAQCASLLDDSERRRRMSEAAAAICDGAGTERVLSFLPQTRI